MRKQIYTCFSCALMIIAFNCTAFAATTPFSDVSTDSWAYKAIIDLSKKGIIDGVGDNSYQGDRPLSRYEAAILVSKAMQNMDKATAEQKIIISGLESEFSKEMTDIDSRMSAIEKKQPSYKIYGDARIRYYNNFDLNRNGATKGTSKYSRAQERVRLYFSTDIDPRWSFTTRLAAQNTVNRSSYGTTPGEEGSSPGEVQFDVADFTYKATPNWLFGIGRAKVTVGTVGILSSGVGFWDGARIQYDNKKFAGRVMYADISQAILSNLAIGKTSITDSKNLILTDFTYKPNSNIEITGAYLDSQSDSLKWKISDIGAKIQLNKDYWMQTEALHNASHALDSDSNAQRNAYYASLNYKKIDLQKPHTYSVGINYKKAGKDTAYENMTSLVSMSNTYGVKGWGLSYDYVLARNVQGTLLFEKLTPYNQKVNNFKYQNVVGGVLQL